jgi:hypothetical protein
MNEQTSRSQIPVVFVAVLAAMVVLFLAIMAITATGASTPHSRVLDWVVLLGLGLVVPAVQARRRINQGHRLGVGFWLLVVVWEFAAFTVWQRLN